MDAKERMDYYVRQRQTGPRPTRGGRGNCCQITSRQNKRLMKKYNAWCKRQLAAAMGAKAGE